jgi:hypothetical protein
MKPFDIGFSALIRVIRFIRGFLCRRLMIWDLRRAGCGAGGDLNNAGRVALKSTFLCPL